MSLGSGTWRSLAVRVARVAIGALFLVAALAKLADLPGFAEQVHNFRIVPIPTENLLALTLPWIELVAGLALISNVQARAGALIVAALLVVFSAAVISAMARGLNIECGCFGKADSSGVGVSKLLQNAGMFCVALVGALRSR